MEKVFFAIMHFPAQEQDIVGKMTVGDNSAMLLNVFVNDGCYFGVSKNVNLCV